MFLSIEFGLKLMSFFRSWDGLTLYAASSDGTIAAFQFDPTELEGIASETDQEQYLAKFGFTPPPLPEGYSHVSKQEPAKIALAQTQQASAFDGGSHGPDKVNILVAKRAPKDKKRVGLMSNTAASTVPTSRSTPLTTPHPSTQPNGIGTTGARRAQLSHIQDTHPAHTQTPMHSAFSSSFPNPSEQPFLDSSNWSRHADIGQAMELDVQIDAFDAGGASARVKRKASAVIDLTDDAGGKAIRPRTLGGDRPVEMQVPRSISKWTPSRAAAERGWTGVGGSGGGRLEPLLPTPPLLTYLSSEVDGTNELFEVKNVEETGMFS
jgi:protein HIRA/HIR1